MLSLTEATTLTGLHRSRILRAIQRGAITGNKNHNDTWQVDGAELARVFHVTLRDAQPGQPDAKPNTLAAHRLELAEQRITELRERAEELKGERDRAQSAEDAWKAQCEAVTQLLAMPTPHAAQTSWQIDQLQIDVQVALLRGLLDQAAAREESLRQDVDYWRSQTALPRHHVELAQKLHAPLAALCDQLHRVRHFMRRMLRPGTA
jgi:hypothetical protein